MSIATMIKSRFFFMASWDLICLAKVLIFDSKTNLRGSNLWKIQEIKLFAFANAFAIPFASVPPAVA